MDILIKVHRDEKIKVLKYFRETSTPEEKLKLDKAINLTRQSAVIESRIRRIARVTPNADDVRRVRAGRLVANEIPYPGKDMPGPAFGLSAQKSYDLVNGNYHKLPADVKTTANPVVVASVRPQANNLATLLYSNILKPKTIRNFKELITSLDVISKFIKACGALAHTEATKKTMETYASMVELAKGWVELYEPYKFHKDFPKYMVAMECWVQVGNRMIDYIDPNGAWSFYDFH